MRRGAAVVCLALAACARRSGSQDTSGPRRLEIWRVDAASDLARAHERGAPFPAMPVDGEGGPGLQIPREHAEALASYAAGWSIPTGHRVLVAPLESRPAFVRTYVVADPPAIAGSCAHAEARGQETTVRLDPPCASALAEVTAQTVGAPIVVAIDGVVLDAPVVHAPLRDGVLVLETPLVDGGAAVQAR